MADEADERVKQEPVPEAAIDRTEAVIRLTVIGLLAVVAVVLYLVTPMREVLSGDAPRRWSEAAGIWAAPLYVLAMGVLMALWIPGTVIVLLGTAVFGPARAAPLNYLGGVTGAALGFLIARAIGGGALDALLRRKAGPYETYRRLMGTDGFKTMFYLRAIPTPFNVISYLAGLSPIRFGTYLTATALGMLPASFAFTYVIGAVIEFIKHWNAAVLVEPRTLLALLVYTGAIAAPALLSRWRRMRG